MYRLAPGILFLAVILTALHGRATVAAERPPNVVLIFCDDLAFADLSCYGQRRYATPHLDSMAREGTRFTHFRVAQAVCSASRAALLTGCYPNRIGISGALSPSARHGLHDNETTIAEMLKTRGYKTAMYGKWHLGHHPPFLPTRHGFDDYFGLPYSNDMWPQHPTAKFPDLPLLEGERTIELNPDQRKLTKQYTERAVKFIKKNNEHPFFLYVAHSMPHVPLFVSDRFKDRSGAGLYGDVIQELDWSVGEILHALKKTKIDDNTLVIFTSDNGPWLSYGEHAGDATPLREGKGTSWDGGVRVPCIARWPGKIPAGRECAEPWMTIDVLPTLARLADAPLPQLPIDGRDAWPLLAGDSGAKTPHAAYYLYYAENELQAVVSGKWKLVLPHKYRTLGDNAGGTGGKPANYSMAIAELALYDVSVDAGEANNLATQHPDIVAALQKHAEAARDELGDKLTGRTGKNVRKASRLEN